MVYNSIITNTRFTFRLLRQTKGVPTGTPLIIVSLHRDYMFWSFSVLHRLRI